MSINYSITELRELASVLSEKTHVPFHQMTHSFLKRRLALVYDRFAIRRTEQFLAKLEEADFVDHLLDEFTVDTTEMFRDAGMWRMLRQLLLADSLETKITIYIPFVSTGEELYSLLVLLTEADLLNKVNIIANHWSNRALNRVKAGIYNTKQNDVNLHNYKRFEGVNQLESYFDEIDNTFFFRADLLSNVQFTCEALSVKSIDKQHVVLFRNSMLIYNKQFQEELVKSVDDKIVSGGILCIGVKELLPDSILDRFENIDFRERIYRKHKMLTN